MGADYYAYAVIGCEVPVNKLYKEYQKPHADHAVPDGAKFCPTCGKPASITARYPIFNEDNDSIDNFHIYWGTDNKYAVIGTGVTMSSRGLGFMHFDEIPAINLRLQLRDTLFPFGLWDEEKYGLYAVLYCSY